MWKFVVSVNLILKIKRLKNEKNIHKIGAVFYVLWGIIHVIGGSTILFQEDSSLQIAMQATAIPLGEFQEFSNSALHGILSYHAFNIVWFGIFAILVSVLLKWKNSAFGYWINLLVLSAIELGLLFFLLIPGYMSWSDGGIGLGCRSIDC